MLKRKKSVSEHSNGDLEEQIDSLLHTNTQDGELEMQNFLNIASLLPEQLLTIEVEIGGVKTTALLDTGADNNLMRKSICSEAKLKLNRTKNVTIRGIGSENSTTEGRVMTDCTYYGIEARNTQFDVIEDSLIGYPIILSRKFCENQNLILNVKKRKISKVNEDASKITVYLNENDASSKEVIQENVKVYSAERLLLKPGMNEVPVYMNLVSEGNDSNLYYNGQCKNHKIEGVWGSLSTKMEEKVIFIKRKEGESGHICVKKGDVVGTVSTMVQLDAEEEEEEERSWRLEELKEILDIGELEPEKRDNDELQYKECFE